MMNRFDVRHRGSLWCVSLVGLIVTMTTHTFAGPPLLCPLVVFTKQEAAWVAEDVAKALTDDVAAKRSSERILASSKARFRIEAIRNVWKRRGRDGFATFAKVFRQAVAERRRAATEQTDDGGTRRGATTQSGSGRFQFELQLVQVFEDFTGEKGAAAALRMATIAAHESHAVYSYIAAEAIDIAAHVEPGMARADLDRRSLVLVRRAIDLSESMLKSSKTRAEGELVVRLIATHHEKMRHMHRGDEWEAIRERITKLATTAKHGLPDPTHQN